MESGKRLYPAVAPSFIYAHTLPLPLPPSFIYAHAPSRRLDTSTGGIPSLHAGRRYLGLSRHNKAVDGEGSGSERDGTCTCTAPGQIFYFLQTGIQLVIAGCFANHC
jgi:hypothetical protein